VNPVETVKPKIPKDVVLLIPEPKHENEPACYEISIRLPWTWLAVAG